MVVSAVLVGTPIILARTRYHFPQLEKAQTPKAITGQQPGEDNKTLADLGLYLREEE